MTASASARTARPISRSSIWPCCAPRPTCGLPPRRRGGDGRGLGTGADRDRHDALGPVADAPEPADPAHRPQDPNLCAQGAYVLAEAEGKRRRHPDGHRLGSRDRDGGARSVAGRGDRHARRLHALLGACSRTRTRPTAAASCRLARSASASRPRSPGWDRWLCGERGERERPASSACTASAPRPRRKSYTPISASPPRRWRWAEPYPATRVQSPRSAISGPAASAPPRSVTALEPDAHADGPVDPRR
jgi:hypothetical protein